MSGTHTLFVVDDVDAVLLLLKSSLEPEYNVTCFSSAEDCLEALAEEKPDMFLLDVDLPGMNGYDLCRALDEDSGTSNLPVIFISGLDDLDSRIEGYEAGGIDFVIKPFKVPELRKKIAVALEWVSEHENLTSQMADGELLTSLIMSNLDEYAALIGFLRQLNDCNTLDDVTEAVFKLLRAYHLESILQLRETGYERTVSANGDNSPMEVTVINHIREMDRIFTFGKRTAYNFERITILVNNMPVGDSELCGRLRDHVAIGAEAVNAKLAALEAFSNERRVQKEVGQLVNTVKTAMNEFSTKYEEVQNQGAMMIHKLLEKLLHSFAPLALSEFQEHEILNLIENEVRELISIYDFGDENQQALRSLLERLSSLMGVTSEQR